MERVALFIRHTTQPGQREAVKAIWEQHMAPAIAQNPGHEAYFYCFNQHDPDSIVVYQQYASVTASQTFLTHPSYLTYLAAVEGLLVGPPEVTAAIPQWIKTM